MLWSILIATLAYRQDKLLELLDGLLPQVIDADIEVVALRNYGRYSIGAYRQALLDNARGEYVSFVDDDDLVAGSYVADISAELRGGCDVVGFSQVITGLPGVRGRLSVDYWEAPSVAVMYDGYPTYLRYVNHLTPVRAEVARKAGFDKLKYGEDQAYSQRLHALLDGARSAYIEKPLYTYRWSSMDTSASSVNDFFMVPVAIQHQRRKRRPPPPLGYASFRWHPWSNREQYG